MILIDEIKNTYELSSVINNKFVDRYKRFKEIILKMIFYIMNFIGMILKKEKLIDNEGISAKILYIVNNGEINQKHINRLIKLVKENNSKSVILSRNLYKNDALKAILKENHIKVIDGKILYENLIFDMIKEITYFRDNSLNVYEISILINNKDDRREKLIFALAKECKRINIVTKYINKFEKIKENLKLNYGIILNVTTNTKKTLSKSDIIINYDLDEKEFKKVNISRNAIIFNISNNLKFTLNSFSGINITDYEIYPPEKQTNLYNKILKNFKTNMIYEGVLLFNGITDSEILKRIYKDKVKLRYFIGNIDKIKGREFINLKSESSKQIKNAK